MSSQQKRKILVIGATGKCGILAVSKLLTTNAEVTVTYRDQKKLTTIFGSNLNQLKTLQCDLSNEDEIKKISLRNYDCILIASGATDIMTPVRFVRTLFGWYWPTHPYYVEYKMVHTLVQLAKRENPSIKFVIISSYGEYQPWLISTLLLNAVLCGIMKYKHFANQTLRESGLDYTILLPKQLSDNKKQNVTLRFFQKSQGQYINAPRFSSIARPTVAQLAVDACLKTNIATKATIDVWEQERHQVGGFLFDWIKIENDFSSNLFDANFELPYYVFLTTMVIIGSTIVIKYKYPQYFDTIKSLIWK